MRAKKLAKLRQLLRRKTDTFEFNALIDGVSTLEEEARGPTDDTWGYTAQAYRSQTQYRPRLQTLDPARSTDLKPLSSRTLASRRPEGHVSRRQEGYVIIRAKTARRILAAVLTLALLTMLLSCFGVYLLHARAATQPPRILNDWSRRGLPDPALTAGEKSLHIEPIEVGSPMPDPMLTPGETGVGVNGVAQVPEEVRRRVMRSYGIDPWDTRYILCQLIPGFLNGTVGPKNLFPITRRFLGLKQRLDTRLEQLIQGRELTAQQARQDLTTNWIRAVHIYHVRNYGLSDDIKARQREEQLHW